MILNWTCRHDLACSLGQRFATLNFIEALPIGQTRRAVNRAFCHADSDCGSGAGPATCPGKRCYSCSCPMITEALQRIANERESLTREEARAVMTEVFSGSATDAQIAALLVALHMKGETVEEIVGFAEAMRAAAEPLPLHQDSTLEVSGTGRDALVDT